MQCFIFEYQTFTKAYIFLHICSYVLILASISIIRVYYNINIIIIALICITIYKHSHQCKVLLIIYIHMHVVLYHIVPVTLVILYQVRLLNFPTANQVVGAAQQYVLVKPLGEDWNFSTFYSAGVRRMNSNNQGQRPWCQCSGQNSIKSEFYIIICYWYWSHKNIVQ